MDAELKAAMEAYNAQLAPDTKSATQQGYEEMKAGQRPTSPEFDQAQTAARLEAPVLPIGVMGLQNAATADQQAKLIRQAAENNALGMTQYNVVPAGVIESGPNAGQQLFKSDQPIRGIFGEVPADKPFSTSGWSQTYQNVKDAAPLMVAGGPTIGLMARLGLAFTSGTIYKATQDAAVDLNTGDQRSGFTRALGAVGAGVINTLGEAGGTLANVLLGKAVPEVLTALHYKTSLQAAPAPQAWVDPTTNEMRPDLVAAFERQGVRPEDVSNNTLDQIRKMLGVQYLDPNVVAAGAEARGVGIEPMTPELLRTPEVYAAQAKTYNTANKTMVDRVSEQTDQTIKSVKTLAGVDSKDITPGVTRRLELAKNTKQILRLSQGEENAHATGLYTTARELPEGDLNVPTDSLGAAYAEVMERFKGFSDFDPVLKDIDTMMYKSNAQVPGGPEVNGRFTIDESQKLFQNLNSLASRKPELTPAISPIKRALLNDLSNLEAAVAPGAAQFAAQSKLGPVPLRAETSLNRSASEVADKLLAYQVAASNYKEYSTKWAAGDLVQDLVSKQSYKSPLDAVADANVIPKLKSVSREQLQRVKSALMEAPQQEGVAITGKDVWNGIRATALLDALEDSIETSNKSTLSVVNGDKFSAALKSWDEGSLETLFTTDQMKNIRTLERVLKAQKRGALLPTAPSGGQDPIQVSDTVYHATKAALGSVWLSLSHPFLSAGVAAGKLASYESVKRVPGATARELAGGLDTLTKYKNLPSASQKQLMSDIEARYPKISGAIFKAFRGAGEASYRGIKAAGTVESQDQIGRKKDYGDSAYGQQ
jgi:hypothetical protein